MLEILIASIISLSPLLHTSLLLLIFIHPSLPLSERSEEDEEQKGLAGGRRGIKTIQEVLIVLYFLHLNKV